MILTNDNRKWSWNALGLLIIFWFFCVAVTIVSCFFQKEFFNPEFLIPFFYIGSIGSVMLSLAILVYDFYKSSSWFWWTLYSINALLISYMLIKINWNQSLFVFLFLINIVAVGLTLKSKGSYLIGLISLIGYNFAVLSSSQNKLYSHLSSILVNNCSMILISYFSGQITEYFDALGIKLDLAQKDIRKIKNLHELILSKIPSGVLTVDVRTRLVQWNERAQSILSESIFNNKDSWENLYNKMSNKTFNGNDASEFIYEDNSNRKKVIRSQRAEIKFHESDEKAEIFVLEDVTQLREIEENLRNQEKLAAIGKLAAGIAHEIRNPLASISGSVQLLSSQAGSTEDKKLFNIVIKETDRLNHLITEFLDYAKPLVPPTDPVKVISLVNEVLEIIKLNNKLRSDIRIQCYWQGDPIILGYKDKLKQALLNILLNSFQALEQTTDPTLILSLDLDNGYVVFRIKDNGVGMKEETRKRIFEPFFTTKVKGTGLGLAITHKVLEAHGASIMVESEVGRGTEFVIKIKEYDRF